jgi:6-phosphogluconolactonase
MACRIEVETHLFLRCTLLLALVVGCSSGTSSQGSGGAGGTDLGSGGVIPGAGGIVGSGGVSGLVGAGGVLGPGGSVDGSIDGSASCNSTVGGGQARFAYVAAAGANEIFAFAVASSTGALTATGSPVLTSDPRQLLVDPSNKFLLVAGFGTISTCSTGCALVSYAIDQTTGALTPTGSAAAGTNPISLTINSTSTRVYTANTNSNDVSIFTLDPATGALSASGTVAAGQFPEWLTLSPDGKFLYVANSGSNNVSSYSVDATTGALTSMGTVASGTAPTFVIVHPTGKFAYTANANANTVSLYTRDTTTGVLTPTVDIPAGATSRSIAIEPSGHFAYVADQTQIMAFAIDPTNGLMRSIGAPTPISLGMGSQPYYLTTDPGGTHLYVGLANANTIELFAIDATTGALCPVGSPVKAESNSMHLALMR